MKVYQVELTNVCNKKCTFCPTRYTWSKRESGFARLELIDRIDFTDTEYVELQLSGEPGMHPDIVQFVSALKDKGVLVGLATNASIDIDYSLFDSVTVTHADGRTDRVPPGANVTVQRLGCDWPYEDYSHSEESKRERCPACDTPQHYISIQWDGDAVPCCKCHGKQHVLGNVYQQSMGEIEHGVARREFLKGLMRGTNYICLFCSAPNPHGIHEGLIANIKGR
jgi:radical SAM protein with 4Fe4S-binding SPASM domain